MAGSNAVAPEAPSGISPTTRVWWIAGTRVWWIAGGLVLGALTWFTATRAAAPNQGFADAASVLTVASLVAVAIERLIEVFWSVMSRLKDAWWPLNQMAAAVDQLVQDTNVVAKPAFDAAIAGLEAAQKAIDVTADELKALDAEIAKVKAQADAYGRQIEQISKLARDNQRVQLLATTAFQAANRLDTAYGTLMPAVRQAFNDASQVTTGVSDILAGFKDNPAKKVISIGIGWGLGMIVAGFVGLDLFAAAGAPIGQAAAIKGQTPPMFPFVGVALTGFVLGLGANPTHEVIKLVTEAAKGRRVRNLGIPNVSGSPDDRDEADVSGAREERPRAREGKATRADHRILDRLPGSTATSTPRVQPGSMNLR